MFDVIIVGGSYSGLATAMALGRALMKVLIIDDGKPCNQQTPFSHNFLTNDGNRPADITAIAKLQVSRYDTIEFVRGLAVSGKKVENWFEITVSDGQSFTAKNLVFATGIKDVLPNVDGLSDCWGISALHCPYCHGYEVRNEITGVLGDGEPGFDFTRLISNWTKDLTLFTNGSSNLTYEQRKWMENHHVQLVEKQIARLAHTDGYIHHIIFKDDTKSSIKALYTPSPFIQHCNIPELMGCELTADGYYKIDNFYETTIKGIYAVGDNVSRMRTVANAVAMGTTAGMTISKKLILGRG